MIQQLCRVFLTMGFQVCERQQPTDGALSFIFGFALHLQAERNVLCHPFALKKCVLLKDNAYSPGEISRLMPFFNTVDIF